MLGAGGMVGLAYHAGVLRALEVLAGVVADDADVIIGSSAGSVAGAYVRSGVSTEQLWQLVEGTHPSVLADGSPGPQTRAQVWAPASRDPIELGRRVLGSGYVLGRAMLRVPGPNVPAGLQRLFPAGLFSMQEGRRRLRHDLPAAWPDKPLWLCTVDVSTGRRVILGRSGAPDVALPEAVMASCAIPGVYRPVRVGERTLMDGGVHSSSNLDLAVGAGCDLVIGVVPMAYDPASRPGRTHQVLRRSPARALAGEVAYARRQGLDVLLFRPDRRELRLHGVDLMRPHGLEAVARAAYESAARSLETDRFRDSLGGLAA